MTKSQAEVKAEMLKLLDGVPNKLEELLKTGPPQVQLAACRELMDRCGIPAVRGLVSAKGALSVHDLKDLAELRDQYLAEESAVDREILRLEKGQTDERAEARKQLGGGALPRGGEGEDDQGGPAPDQGEGPGAAPGDPGPEEPEGPEGLTP